MARDEECFSAAFGLIYDAYCSAGLARPNRWRLRILPHQLLDTSWIVLVARDNHFIGTVSLIEDAAMDLPSALLYPTQIRRLRRRANRVAELACLALDRRAEIEGRAVLRLLLQAALFVAAERRVDCLAICVHPKHARFYRRHLGFREFGRTRRCPWVCNQPAVGLSRMLGAQNSAVVPRNESFDASLVGPSLDELRLGRLRCRTYFQRLLDEVSPLAWPDRHAGAA